MGMACEGMECRHWIAGWTLGWNFAGFWSGRPASEFCAFSAISALCSSAAQCRANPAAGNTRTAWKSAHCLKLELGNKTCETNKYAIPEIFPDVQKRESFYRLIFSLHSISFYSSFLKISFPLHHHSGIKNLKKNLKKITHTQVDGILATHFDKLQFLFFFLFRSRNRSNANLPWKFCHLRFPSWSDWPNPLQ